jgi:small subunit ribosomal protein S7
MSLRQFFLLDVAQEDGEVLVTGLDAVEAMIRALMKNGSRSRARRLLSRAFTILAERYEGRRPEDVLMTSISNATPVVETFTRKIDCATYRVPRTVPVSARRSRAIRKILRDAQRTKARSAAEGLADAIGHFVFGSDPSTPDPDRTKGALRLSARAAYRRAWIRRIHTATSL